MSEMTLRMPSNYVDVDREEMEYIDGGYSLWQKAVVATALVAAGAGLVAALAYGQIWLAASIMRVTFAGAVALIGPAAVIGIIGVDTGISVAVIGAALHKFL